MRSYGYSASLRLAPRLLCLLILCAACAACSPRQSDPYALNKAYRTGGMEVGTVSNVSEVLITEQPGDNLVLGGAGVGAVGGFVLSGNPIGGAVGAAVGAYAGDYHTKDTTVRFKALAITVTMDNGAIVTVAQEEDDVYLVGDRVYILYERDRAQVRHQ